MNTRSSSHPPNVLAILVIQSVVCALGMAGVTEPAASVTKRVPVVGDPHSQTLSPAFQASLLSLPLAFERNDGQFDGQVKFLSRGAGYDLFLTQEALVVVTTMHASFNSGKGEGAVPELHVIRLSLIAGNKEARVRGLEPLPGKSNYLLSGDKREWQLRVPHYRKVKYEGVYPGIDLVYYGNQGQLEYDFLLEPGADPDTIILGVEGADGLEIDDRGDLLLGQAPNLRQLRPVAYQEIDGRRREIPAEYVLRGHDKIGFQVAEFDAAHPLTIDPILVPAIEYSTYLGGSDTETGNGIAVDSDGNAYVTGLARSGQFPTTAGSFQPGIIGSGGPYVTKFSADGSTLIYSTFLGADGAGWDVAVNDSGNAYVVGHIRSTSFPTVNAVQPAFGGGFQDAFLTVLTADGSGLVYSTFLGGADHDTALGVAVDPAGNAHVAGWTQSSDFPVMNPLQPAIASAEDAFVARVSADGSTLVYSTYLGGSADDGAAGIAVDSAGYAYVTGTTSSTDFPTAFAYQSSFVGGAAYVTKISPDGSSLDFSTFLAGSTGSSGRGIAVDALGSAYVAGTTSSPDFPTVNAFQTSLAGTSDNFITKFHPDGSSLEYSSFFGGVGGSTVNDIAVDSGGNAYIVGTTSGTDLPTVNPFQHTYAPANDAFVAKIGADGLSLEYSSYLGGPGGNSTEFGNSIAVDGDGNAYVAGTTISTSFPTVNAFQETRGGGTATDAFVAKIGLELLTLVEIDIKPGSDPNSINLSSAGNVPVAILSSGGFDATEVNPDTVTLAGASVGMKGKSDKLLAHEEDVNGDGLTDLVCQVITEELSLLPGATTAALRGETFGGTKIGGEDSVNIVPDN